jgi:hypothetical protein
MSNAFQDVETKKSHAFRIAGMKRRELDEVEMAEALRLRELWEKYKAENEGATQAWLAAEAGLGTQGAVSQYLRGVIPLNLESLMAFARVLGVQPSEISPRLAAKVHGISAQGVEVADHDNPKLIAIKRVKLKLSAGIMGFSVEPDRRDGGLATVPRRWVEQNDYIPERLLAMEVKGESMEPALYAGDLVIVNTADTRPVDGAVYAVNYEGEPVIKRLVRDGGFWWLSSDHSDQRKYSRKRCEGDMCIIVGRVVRKESERI